MLKPILYFVFLIAVLQAGAQTPADSVVGNQAQAAGQPAIKKDSTIVKNIKKAVKKDTGKIVVQPVVPLAQPADTASAVAFKAITGRATYRNVLKSNPYYNFFGKPDVLAQEERHTAGKEALFYMLAGLMLFFALVKLLFNKYITNLLGLIFRGSVRQKQIREQLLQTPLPSLFMNVFFVVVAGLYVYFLLRFYKALPGIPFWLLLLNCIFSVGLVYLVKFMILKLTGWIFNMRDAADTYIFIVFLVNKLLAIFLLPLLIVMAFSLTSWGNVLLTLSYIMVVVFFAYRYIVSFAPVRREVKVSQFHFFMYLCAFEIIPLLLIYKVLVRFF